MIHSNKNLICLLLVSLLMCVACSDETLIGPNVKEGVPVTATISFQSTDPVKIETRATDISKDNTISSLAVFIFKTGGEIVTSHFCTSEELANKSIQIRTTSGNRLIYGIANYENSLFSLKDELEKISSFKELKQLGAQLLQESISVLDGEFLMSGWVVPNGEEYDYTSDQSSCSISEIGTVSGKLFLKHVMSSVQFKVTCTNNQATFIPSSWQLKSIPKNTYVFEQKNDYADEDAVYFNSKASNDFSKEESYNTFSFLMMENRKETQGNATPKTYDEREKTSGKAEDFTIANTNSTYVVLEGTYEGMTEETVNNVDGEKHVKAHVYYYIHLGMWKDENGDTNFANFDIFRNNRYTYTVKVVGVDKLIVEVEKSDEANQMWGGDGEMLLSSQNVRTFDAHYETTVIAFEKGQLLDLIKAYGIDVNGGEEARNLFITTFPIRASTPRNSFVADATDIEWVQYRRNNKDVTSFAKYKKSGDINYNNTLLNSKGFKADLFDAARDANYNNDDSIRYTCFIDEYYYGGPAGNYNPYTIGGPGLLINEFVNAQSRSIQIGTYFKENTMSPSTLSMATYTFTQRSISTIFDLDYLEGSDANNGWGTEWSQEGDDMPVNNLTTKNQFDQGRNNMWGFFNLKRDFNWDLYIDHTKNSLNNGYKYAEYACLTRNRDLNGNGVIDADELRWYLPALKQYLGFVIGEDALPRDARLYTQGDGGGNSSYVTSSAYVDGYYVLSADQGTSIGQHTSGRSYPYRCVRNLRKVTYDVVNFVEPSNDSYNDRTAYEYSFNRLNSKAKRNSVNGPLTYGHTIFDEENRLSTAFSVQNMWKLEEIITSEGHVSKVLTWQGNQITASAASSTNPCSQYGTGWRLPNQRELAVIVYNPVGDASGLNSNSNLFSCTKSDESYCGFNKNITSMTTWGNINNLSSQPIEYRCIKDK